MGGGGGGEGEPAKESILSRILSKVDETYAWVEAKVKSFFKLFSESFRVAFLGIKSFVSSCCEKLREVLSGINAQMDNSSEKEMVVEMVPEEVVLLDEMKKLVHNLEGSILSFAGVGVSPEIDQGVQKMKGFLYLVEGFIDLLQYSLKQPRKLIMILVNGYSMYRSNTAKSGGVIRVSKHQCKASMAVATMINLIAPPVRLQI